MKHIRSKNIERIFYFDMNPKNSCITLLFKPDFSRSLHINWDKIFDCTQKCHSIQSLTDWLADRQSELKNSFATKKITTQFLASMW